MKSFLERKVKSGIPKPSSLVALTKTTEPFKEVFPKLFKWCKIAVASLCYYLWMQFFHTQAGENLRSTMDDDRLSSLGVLSVESGPAKSLDLEEL